MHSTQQKQHKPLFVLMTFMIIATLFCHWGDNASGATPAEIQQWLQAHNNYRTLHGVPSVTWSTVLETSAQTYANSCPSGHSGWGYGENIFWCDGYAPTPQGVVDLWYSEEQYYDYNNPGSSNPPGNTIGHFTQVVWKSTTQIGCGCKNGCSVYVNGSGPYSDVCVCQYSPPGNVLGQYAANVFPPSAGPGLGEAVDNTSLTWTTGGNAVWFGQTATTHHGGDAAQSGAITHNQTSRIETTVTGPGTLTFYWKVSSEANYDYLRFYIDGAEQPGGISGTVDWQQKTYSIASGNHTLKWAYTKDGSESGGSDAGWLDKVVFTSTTSMPWLELLLLDD